MTQQQKIKAAISEGMNTISAIQEHTNILRPSIRRVLGQGTIKGIFKRLDKGVYTLTTTSGETRAYIHTGESQEVLPQLAAEGHKFDMVFLDPAYFSDALVGGNRGIKHYDFVLPDHFSTCMKWVKNMLRTEDSHVYLMLSGAPTAQYQMQQYLFSALESGLQYISEGKYKKMFQNGRPVTNVRGAEAAPERLILLSPSGRIRQGEISDIQLNFQVERPAIKSSYSTQKSDILTDRLILQSTYEHEHCADIFAGSGVFGESALKHNRIVTLIEKAQEAITNFIVPRILKFT